MLNNGLRMAQHRARKEAALEQPSDGQVSTWRTSIQANAKALGWVQKVAVGSGEHGELRVSKKVEDSQTRLLAPLFRLQWE